MIIPVIDASLAFKWLVREDGSDAALQVLEELEYFLVPDWFYLEIDSILTRKVRTGQMETGEAFQKRKQFRMLPCKTIFYSDIQEFAFRLAADLPVTLYDACYLAIAVEFDSMMYTFDARLARGLANTPFSKHIKLFEY